MERETTLFQGEKGNAELNAFEALGLDNSLNGLVEVNKLESLIRSLVNKIHQQELQIQHFRVSLLDREEYNRALMELRSDWKRDVESIQERHEEKEKKLRSDMRQLVSSVRGVIDEGLLTTQDHIKTFRTHLLNVEQELSSRPKFEDIQELNERLKGYATTDNLENIEEKIKQKVEIYDFTMLCNDVERRAFMSDVNEMHTKFQNNIDKLRHEMSQAIMPLASNLELLNTEEKLTKLMRSSLEPLHEDLSQLVSSSKNHEERIEELEENIQLAAKQSDLDNLRESLSDYLTREEHSELMLDLNSRFKLTSLKLDKVVKDSRASQETVQKMQADLEVKIGKAEFFELRNYCDTLETKEVHQADIDRLCADAAVLAKALDALGIEVETKADRSRLLDMHYDIEESRNIATKQIDSLKKELVAEIEHKADIETTESVLRASEHMKVEMEFLTKTLDDVKQLLESSFRAQDVKGEVWQKMMAMGQLFQATQRDIPRKVASQSRRPSKFSTMEAPTEPSTRPPTPKTKKSSQDHYESGDEEKKRRVSRKGHFQENSSAESNKQTRERERERTHSIEIRPVPSRSYSTSPGRTFTDTRHKNLPSIPIGDSCDHTDVVTSEDEMASISSDSGPAASLVHYRCLTCNRVSKKMASRVSSTSPPQMRPIFKTEMQRRKWQLDEKRKRLVENRLGVRNTPQSRPHSFTSPRQSPHEVAFSPDIIELSEISKRGNLRSSSSASRPGRQLFSRQSANSDVNPAPPNRLLTETSDSVTPTLLTKRDSISQTEQNSFSLDKHEVRVDGAPPIKSIVSLTL